MAKCVLCEKEIGDLEESSLHQCNMLRHNKSSPPPDVVEAARRLMTDFADMQDVELVCEWVLSQK